MSEVVKPSSATPAAAAAEGSGAAAAGGVSAAGGGADGGWLVKAPVALVTHVVTVPLKVREAMTGGEHWGGGVVACGG